MLILVALAILAGGLLLIRAGVKIIGALISLVGFLALAAVVARYWPLKRVGSV